jgi:hypothetical protein
MSDSTYLVSCHNTSMSAEQEKAPWELHNRIMSIQAVTVAWMIGEAKAIAPVLIEQTRSLLGWAWWSIPPKLLLKD